MMIQKATQTLLLCAVVAGSAFAADVEEQKEILADKMFKNGGMHWTHSVPDTLIDFKMTASCWESANDPARGNVAHSMSWTNRHMKDFFKRMDWTINTLDEMESNETGTFNEKRNKMKDALKAIAPKFKITLDASRMECKNKMNDKLLGAYLFETASQLGTSWKPQGDSIQFVVVMDPTARAMKVTANPNRSVITITGPTEIEVAGWASVIADGIAKYGR